MSATVSLTLLLMSRSGEACADQEEAMSLSRVYSRGPRAIMASNTSLTKADACGKCRKFTNGSGGRAGSPLLAVFVRYENA
jgi:hypothetical protein